MDEIVGVLLFVVVLAFLVSLPVLVIVAWARTGHLAKRVLRLERQLVDLQSQFTSSEPVADTEVASAPKQSEVPVDAVVLAEIAPLPRQPISWELFIGRKALGWIAVVVLLFATAFFLRYAFENEWIGPVGRVAIGIVTGLALIEAGRRFYLKKWTMFSQMLTAAGIVLLYLATFSAFGFYHLVGQREAGLFLFILVAESALLALRYEAPAVALMAVVGGLLTPVLMHSDRDQYVSLFSYLAVLNAGAVWLLLRRAWPAVGSVALLGTQWLFWLWYTVNYHPRKLAWALGFQAVVFALYLGHSLLVNLVRRRSATWEDVGRLIIAPICFSAAGYVLLRVDYRPWLGTLAMSMAAGYALVARLLFVRRDDDFRLLLAAPGVSAGFLALAVPLEANVSWVALGWATEAGVLWWCGVRMRRMPLRAMAAMMAVAAVVRMGINLSDALNDPLEFAGVWLATVPRFPIFNRYALPPLAATACLATALAMSGRWLWRLGKEERALTGMAAVVCVLLVWGIESLDLGRFFRFRFLHQPNLDFDWSRLSQMTISAWWAVYATAVLALGFLTKQAILRWTALGLYGLAVLKVFLFDMAGLDQIYRIVAFFVLALVLGAAAWAYQRIQPDRPQAARL